MFFFIKSVEIIPNFVFEPLFVILCEMLWKLDLGFHLVEEVLLVDDIF